LSYAPALAVVFGRRTAVGPPPTVILPCSVG